MLCSAPNNSRITDKSDLVLEANSMGVIMNPGRLCAWAFHIYTFHENSLFPCGKINYPGSRKPRVGGHVATRWRDRCKINYLEWESVSGWKKCILYTSLPPCLPSYLSASFLLLSSCIHIVFLEHSFIKRGTSNFTLSSFLHYFKAYSGSLFPELT